MQIRTFFHNSNFLRKSVRRLVCVLFMLVACAGAVWGANAYFIWIGGNEGNLWSDPRNWKYSSSGTDYQTQSSGGYFPGDGRSTDKQIWFPGTDNGTFYIVVNQEIHTGELGFHSDETGMASTYIFSTTNGGSIEASSISVKAPPDSSEKSVLNFGNVPVRVTNGDLNINAGETAGTVEIATDASITITGIAMSSGYPSNGKINIGNSANSGSHDTKTVFSGTGTITARALDFPSAHNHEFTVDSGATLNFASSNSNPYIFTTSASNSSVTINGTGTIDLAGVSYNHPDSFATEPGLTVLNGSGTYTYTLTEGSRTGFPSSSFSIEITASTTDGSFDGSKANLTYKLEQTETKFTFNGSSNTSGSITLSGSGTTYSGTYSIACTSSGSLVAGEGFKLTVYQPGNIGLGIVEWYVPSASWTGANGTNWNDSANWTGVTDPTSLSDKDITIEACTNLPVINSGTITVKSLTIKNGASVTQEGGTLTVGSMTCAGTGTFTGNGGSVSFNGTAGTWSDAAGNSVFNNLTVSSGSLTLSSPLHLTGDFDGSGGTLVQGSNAVIFEGSGTAASPQTVKASSAPLGVLTFKGNGGSGYIKLLSNVTCSSLTVEEGVTLDCNGYMLSVNGTLTNKGTVICSGSTPAGMIMCTSYAPAADGSDIVSVSGAVTLVTNAGTISKIKVTDTATISGSVTCGFFEATGLGGETLTINCQLIAGSGVAEADATQTLQLSGTSTGSKLEIAGSGLIKLNASQVGGQYLDVTGSSNVHDMSDGTTVLFSATDSTGPADAPDGWNICTGDLIYVWAGTESSNTWNTAANWNVGMVPPSTGDVLLPANGVECLTPGTATTIRTLTIEEDAGITLLSDLTVTEGVSNDGWLDTNGTTLTFETYDSPSGEGLVILYENSTLVPTTSAASAGTINWLEITESVSFGNISKLSFVNVTVTDATSVFSLSGDFTLTGTLNNKGTVNLNNHVLQFGAYKHTDTSADKILTNGGKIIATGNGTGSTSISAVQGTTGLTVTNNGTGSLKLTSTTFTDSASLTVGSGSGAAPEFTSVTVTGGTLTLNTALDVVTLKNNGTVASAGYDITCTTYTKDSGVTTDALSLSGDVTLSVGTNKISSISYAGGGTLTADGTNGVKAGTLSVTGASGNTTLSGTFALDKLAANDATLGGKTLTINAYLTVGNGATGNAASQTLDLSGVDGALLTIAGSGTIRLNKSQTIGAYLAVSSARPEITKINTSADDVIYTATFSTGTSGNGWNICEGALVYVWTGEAGTSVWNTDGNWSVGVAPVVSSNEVKIEVIDASRRYPMTPSTDTTIGDLTVESGAELTVAGRFSAGTVSNAGTIITSDSSSSLFRFNDYSGNGVIRLGAGSVEARSAASGVSVNNIEFTGTGERFFCNISRITFVNAVVPAGKTIKLSADLTFTGELNNEGTVNTNGHKLTIGSYTDAAETGLVQIAGNNALALNSGGTGGTIKNLEFTADCSFSAVSNISITNAEVKSGVTLTAGSNLVFGGQFANSASNSTVILSGCKLTAKNFSGSGSYSISGAVELESTDSSEAGAGILELVKSSDTASLKQTGLFLIRKLSAESGTLTLNSSIKVVDLTIKQSAAVSAGPSSSSAYTLTIRGNFVNENTGADPVSSVYPGFDAKQSTVELVDNPDVSETLGTDIDQIHYVKGFNRFYNFTCTTASTKGAKVYFDADKTTRIESQLTLGVPASDGGYLVLDTPPGSADDRKWTLDITWNIHGVNDPVIQRVKPHHAISYRAILHDCLIDCIDDGVIDIDSTNKNWFDDMPSILMTLAPIGGRQLFVLFSTEVDAADGRDLRTSIALKKSSDATNLIDDSIPVEEYKGSTGKSKSGIVFTLTRDITWTDLTGSDPLYVEIIDTDAVLKGGSIIPYLQFTKHCLSDYAVNAVRMLFGYDNNIDPSTPLTVETGTNSVRAWDSTNPVVNRLHSESDLLFQAQLEQSVDTGIQLDMVAMLSSQLNTSVIGNNFKDYYGFTTRIWQPFELLAVSTGQQSIPSGQIISQDGTSSGRLRNFSVHYDESAADALYTVPDGDEIQFMFKLLDSTGNDITIDHDCDGTTGQKPLYAIRLRDDSDITSFDLWSVALQSTTLQRGNVTILNNVINSDQREEVQLTVELSKGGNLTVQVLTLDGAVVTTLQRGRKNAGTYGFSWDGSNGKGRPVARGMYFIRIIGPDIDETRKVMVVRD